MSLSTAEAKRIYFLTHDDLRDLPRHTLYGGFGTGRAMNLYCEADLEAAAIAKHGEEGYAKKVAARQKREKNKRKREEAKEDMWKAELAADPKLAKREAAKKQRREAVTERNEKIAGEPWELTITAPERVAGTKATLVIKQLPPDGWPGDSNINCSDTDSMAYSYGNIHGFKGKSSQADAEMKFETKWKVMGVRHKGTLSVRVLPSDRAEEVKEEEGDKAASGLETSKKQGEEPLMVKGKFDCGFNASGVRSWSFIGYR